MKDDISLSFPSLELLKAPDQVTSVDTECYRQSGDVFKRWIALTSLKAPDVGPI